jgi:hypothetical protein
MAHGQTPFSQLFPPIPQGFQEPFWYASLQSFWLYYRVDPELLRSRLPELPEDDALEVALFDFGDGDLAGLASLDLQRYTGHGPSYLETTDEVEFNIYVYPKLRSPDVPLMTWQDYLLGAEQTKTIGGYRLHVPCDNQIAVDAGKALYGEPKYLAFFAYQVPSLNGPPSTSWSYEVFKDVTRSPDPKVPPKGHHLIYGLDCDLAGIPSVPGSPSPLIEYGVLAENQGSDGRVVANFWDFYGPFETYMPSPGGAPLSAEITLGADPDATGTIDDLRRLIGGSQPVAAQVYTSPPASAESRGWYTVRPAPAPSPAGASVGSPPTAFVALSAGLTGFRKVDLWATGQVEVYLEQLFAIVGDAIVARLLLAGKQALASTTPVAALRGLVLDDPDLGPVARSVIILWYLGQWTPLPHDWRDRNGSSPLDISRVISADAYRAGLVWAAAGAHPMGADPPGYGSWATAPATNG